MYDKYKFMFLKFGSSNNVLPLVLNFAIAQ